VAMAISTGKKMAKTGIRMVPRPNPEMNVSRETPNATITIRKYSSIPGMDNVLLADF
jgi:hypothetical protein